MKLIRKVDILGSKYAVYRVRSSENEYMERMHYGGLCCASDRKIYILDLATVEDWKDEREEVRKSSEACTLRHEIIHAFLNESGLQWNAAASDQSWAKNEEMVDWIAIQFPKIFKVYQELGCLE